MAQRIVTVLGRRQCLNMGTSTSRSNILRSLSLSSSSITPQKTKTTKTTTQIRYFSEDTSSQPKKEGEGEEELPIWHNPNVKETDDRIFLDEFQPGEEIPIAQLPPMGDDGRKVQASEELNALANEIINLKFVDVIRITQRLDQMYGFDQDEDDDGEDDDGADGAEGAEAAKEEKTTFDLKLTGFEAKSKIKVIKEVRALTGLGLKEAKEIVESAPKVIQKDIKKDDMEEIQKKLEAVGATVEFE
eukprot:CAMPEP_0178964626 /NCGR_PEP_ID=MMETSP0789-20121207/15786_1 /TAXON_ID=3005 /ORGANISM="Rhizosolenia setigera, Strain CCMP 1694" /LENGTH=244 /DNA_ID=CAMNT_0020649431 /DNA_START=111 /DNA_END=845 /DNA_ORIENTATION=-